MSDSQNSLFGSEKVEETHNPKSQNRAWNITSTGKDLFEVVSTYQKAIRRGDEELALKACMDLFNSDKDQYAWERLMTVVSEDIGIANPHLPSQVHALYGMSKVTKEKTKKHNGLNLIHAVLLCVRSKKSRIVDEIACIDWKGSDEDRAYEIPDYALDLHTRKGKIKKRDYVHFFEEGAKLENEDLDLYNPYKEKCHKIFYEIAKDKKEN